MSLFLSYHDIITSKNQSRLLLAYVIYEGQAIGLYHMCCDSAVYVTISTIRKKNVLSEF